MDKLRFSSARKQIILRTLMEVIILTCGDASIFYVLDPWKYNDILATMSPEHQDHHNMNTAAMVEALGNAALDQSFEHIISFTNSSATPNILRRSSLHSLRNYRSKQVRLSYTLKTAGSFLTLFLVNYAPTKTRGQNYNPFYSQNNPFHGYFLTPFSKLVHS